MKQMQEGPMALLPSVWAALEQGRWCSEPVTMQRLSQHLECLRCSRVLRSDIVNYIQGCLGLQVCPMLQVSCGMTTEGLLHKPT